MKKLLNRQELRGCMEIKSVCKTTSNCNFFTFYYIKQKLTLFISMKIAFFGTGDFSAKILSDLYTNPDIEIALCVSQPDKPFGRKQELMPTPVKVVVQEKNIPLLQPEKLKNNEAFFQTLRDGQFDFIVVVAY